MTLVFAEDRSLPSIKKALLARRTAVYWKNLLIGEEQFLKPIFQAAVEVLGPSSETEDNQEAYVQIRNRSDLPFELEPPEISGKLKYSGLFLPPGKIGILRVSIQAGGAPGVRYVALPFKVKNLLVGPNQSLQIELKIAAITKANVAQSHKND